MPEMHEPSDHQLWVAEKPPGLGIFPNQFKLEI